MIRALAICLLCLCTASVAMAEELVGAPPGQQPAHAATPPPAPQPAPVVETVSAEATRAAQTAERRAAGRLLLVAGQGLHGAGVGLELWTLLYDDDATREGSPELATAFFAGGAAAGIATTLMLSKDGIEPGHASLLNSGSLWGFWLAFTASQANYSLSGRPRAVLSILGQGAGMGLAEGAWRLWKPNRGQVWMVDTTAFWTTMFATGAVLAVTNYDFPPRRPVLAGVHFWAATGGLALGGLFASMTPAISVGRLVLINGMGLLGAVVVPVAGAWLSQGFYELTPGWLLSMSGAAVGLGLTTLLTQNWKPSNTAFASGPQLHLGLSPMENGAGVVLGGNF